MSKMALHEPFGHLQHKLCAKERSGVKLVVWLPTTKSRESTRPRCVQVECNTPLKRSQQSYNFSSNLIPIGGLNKELWAAKVPGVQIGIVSGHFRYSFGTPPWESREKVPFRCRWGGVMQRILYGGRWWLPPSPGHGESCESKVARGSS
jgi:hypothetical protein